MISCTIRTAARTAARGGCFARTPGRALSTAARSPATTTLPAAGLATLVTATLTARGVAAVCDEKKQYKEEVLPEAVKAELTARVDAWRAASQLGNAPPLHFEPTLSSNERKFVHALCEARGSELSSKSEGRGAERHVVVYDVPVEEGVVGGVTAARRVELAGRVEAWKSGIPDQSQGLHFEATLTTAEREYVHHVAAQNGLSSKSEGKTYQGADWHIVVRTTCS